MQCRYKIEGEEVVYRQFEDGKRPKWGTDNPYPLLEELKKPDGYKIKEMK